ncbi:hypothetical protein L7F22_023185 [Adiantum nelumboides]|nr:hypothetical protein [Adiantum nelumboides]
MLIAGYSEKDNADLKTKLKSKFDMKDLGESKHILGIRITRDRKRRLLYLSRTEYVHKVLDRFNMQKGEALSIPLPAYLKLSKNDYPKSIEEKLAMAKILYASACGSLMYAMVATRSDIAHAVKVVSRFMCKIPYASACGSLMYAMVATRSDIAHAVKVVSRFMSNLGRMHWDAVNQSAIALAKNPVFHSRTKHIDVRYHFSWECLAIKSLDLVKILPSENTMDALTKSLSSHQFQHCCELMGIG